MTDTETFDELDRALGTVLFDAEALVAGAVVRGRRIQRRRRIGAGAGVAALTALAVVPGALHSARDHGGAPTDHASDGATTGPEQVTAHLATLLPGPSEPVSAKVVPDGVDVVRSFDPDGSGRGSVGVDVGSDHALRPVEISGAANKCRVVHRDPRGDDCLTVRGGWLFEYVEPVQAGRTRAVDWAVTLVRRDGRFVHVLATNYVDRHAPTRSEPVLDADQLEKLATDPGWFEPTP